MAITIKRKARTQATEVQKKQKRIYNLIKIVPIVILCIFFLICFRFYKFEDTSMNANIAIGTILDSNLTYGDVVICETDGKMQARRIVGMPGDEITFCYDTMYINGKKCEESYYKGATYSGIYSFEIPMDAYFVLADNRTGYSDSREYGAIYEQGILQKVIFMMQKGDIILKQLFLNSNRLLKEADREEREAALLIYVTSFVRMLREGGYLYRRVLESDGTPYIIMIVDGQEYKCQEYVLLKLTNNTLDLYPYEDQTTHLNNIECLPTMNRLADLEEQNTEKKKLNLPNVEVPTIEIEPKVAFEDLPEAPELTLTEEQQADYLMDETERYKIGAGLNFVLGLACIVFAILVMVWA